MSHYNQLYSRLISVLLAVGIAAQLLPAVAEFASDTLNLYGASEFLVNYSGGFVRRGLVGELILLISRLFGLSPEGLVFVACITAYLLVAALSIKACRRLKCSPWIVASPLLCGGVETSLFRKDFILYAGIFLVAYLLANGRATSARRWVAATAILVLMLLSHEAVVFWALPLPLLFLTRASLSRNAKVGLFSAIAIAAAAVTIFKGDQHSVVSSAEAWCGLTATPPEVKVSSGLGALGWNPMEMIRNHLRINFYDDFYGWLTFPLQMALYAVGYYLFTQFFKVFGGDRRLSVGIGRLMIFLTLCSLPLFIALSCDYGRLYQGICFTTLAFCAFSRPEDLDRLLPRFTLTVCERTERAINRWLPPYRAGILLLLLCYSPSPVGLSLLRAARSSLLGGILYTALLLRP